MSRFFSMRSPFVFVAMFGFFNLALVLLSISFSWRLALNLFGLNGVIYPAYLVLHAIALRRHLVLQGYEWATFSDAFVLSAAHMWKSWRIPRFEEAATLPGYENSRGGLSRILMLIASHKREASV